MNVECLAQELAAHVFPEPAAEHPDQAVARTSLSAIAGCRRPPDARSQYPSKASPAGVSTSHGNSAGSPGMGTGEMIRSRSRGPSDVPPELSST